MKIAIVGFDVEGHATYDYFASRGHELVIRDKNPATQVPAGVESLLGDAYLDSLDQFDLIVRTAGLPPRVILEKNADIANKITTHINEFFKACPTNNIVGVTGTKGKGTTSTLIAKMLEATGKHVKIGGNIGVPPLTFLKDLNEDSWVVLELSSFQLIDMHYSPHIGVCLMIVPEHLNWHTDMSEYLQAKSQLFANQKDSDIAVFFAGDDNAEYLASVSPGTRLPYFAAPGAVAENGVISIGGQEICKTSELKLLGEHNWQNVCAALTAVWQVSQDVAALHTVLTTFSGLQHRLELVSTVEGVDYYDDSFGTTPETATVALHAFAGPKIIILGGSDKGAIYDDLAATVVSSNVKAVLLIGDQASRIQTALDRVGFNTHQPGGATMPEIVAKAKALAVAGDTVLLSTACASFDMFQDYKDRGDQFKTAVQALATTA